MFMSTTNVHKMQIHLLTTNMQLRSQHVVFVTFNEIARSMFDRWVCDPHQHSFTRCLEREKSLQESERKRAGGKKGWNMNYRPEQRHLDRENTHHSGEPAHWIRLATGSICTSWNQSHSLIWLGQPHRRKRKLLWSFIKLVLFCTPLHSHLQHAVYTDEFWAHR